MTYYVTIEDVNNYAQDIGEEDWLSYTEQEKKRFHHEAELSIKLYLNQPNDSEGNLWQYENEDLLMAVNEQCLFFGRTNWQRKAAEAVRAETGKSITKGDVEMDVNHRDHISDSAKNLLETVLSSFGLQRMIAQRG